MAEYIDKWQAVSNLICAGLKDDQKAVDAIQFMPAADVKPVVHGKWTLHPDGSATCSECHFWQNSIWDLDNWQNYCGVCGAKIDGVKAEEAT